MAVSEEEKRLARAYNMGYLINTYEPRLMQEIIKHNPKNEFVKAMQVGRDQQEFDVGIPRKDQSLQFKNGYSNGRTLAEHKPETLQRILQSKGLNKDYVRGLSSALQEYKIRDIQKRMNQEPKAPKQDLRQDVSFKRGFNTGYRSPDMAVMVGHSKLLNEKYTKYLDGMKAGIEQHNHDLAKLREKDPEARLFPDDPQTAEHVNSIADHKIIVLDDISSKQGRIINMKETFSDVPPPKWMQEKEPANDQGDNAKEKSKNKKIDLDR